MPNQLQRALKAYRASLPPGKLEEMRIDGADYLGVPIYNVDLFTEDGGHYNGVGYGATPEEALIGAYGELAEECHRYYTFREKEIRTGSYRELLAEVGPQGILDPLTLVLPAGSPYHSELELRWTQVQRLSDGDDVLCPIEFVASADYELGDYPNQLTTAITNGCGAGDTPVRATLHALLELLQRDGNADCFRALDRGRVVDPATTTAEVREVLADLAGKGLRVTLKLARETCGCVSVYAVGDDTTDDSFSLGATGCGEGADPDVHRALRKAALECASSHSRKRFNNLPFDRVAGVVPDAYFQRIRRVIDLEKEEQKALRAMVEFVESDKATLRRLLDDTVFLEQETISAKQLPTYDESKVNLRLQHVLEGFAGEGLEVYRMMNTSGMKHCSFAKVIVPGIEMEFGSYHRLGYRGVKRLLEDDPFGLLHRSSAPGRALVRLTEEKDKELGGPFFLDTAELDRLIDPLYALYREPKAHSAPIAIEQDYFANAQQH